MLKDYGTLMRMVFIIAAGIVGLLMLELIITLFTSPVSFSQLFMFDTGSSYALASAFNRTFNQLLAIVFVTVSIAVPLTANMYSVKFLELFITDRVNLVVLVLFVFGIPNNLWLLHNMKAGYIPAFQLYLSLMMTVLYPAMLIPYLYYVFQFLHPSNLLRSLEKELARKLTEARHGLRKDHHCPREVALLVGHIANIGVRSIERADRPTAAESIHTLQHILHTYWQIKAELPFAWFITGTSCAGDIPEDDQLDDAERHRWMEMTIFAQLREILSAALPRLHDTVNSVATVSRELGLSEEMRQDRHSRELVMEYFNTFIRLAINRRDARSLFTFFANYRRYAEGLCNEDPDLVLEIAYYFQYYAQAAHIQGLGFVVETIAYDMSALVRYGSEHGFNRADKLLERFLIFCKEDFARQLVRVKKAQVILAGYFLLHNLPEQAKMIHDTLKGLDPHIKESIKDDVLHVRRERFWEITDRQINFDYVSDPHRDKIAGFLETL